MHRFRNYLIYGFALFSMFFGSGNLVFPLQIGINSGQYWQVGFMGLLLTGVLLPFLGLFVIKLHQGNVDEFFGQAGMLARVILPLFTLSLLGAFGIIPRCITVAHGGLTTLFPSCSLFIFSMVFCTLCFFICLKERRLIIILGKWLTPVMLGCLSVLIAVGIYHAPSLEIKSLDAMSVFTSSFQRGYKTMDLFAAFFFASFILQQMSQQERGSSMTQFFPSVIGASLLGLVYFGLIYLGAVYAPWIMHLSPELMLPTIAEMILGGGAAWVMGILIILACLTTAVALNNIYAHYLCTLFKNNKNRFAIILLGTTFISFIISLLDFKGIAAFLEPVLDVSYPGIILLTFLSLFTKGFKKIKTVGFYGILFLIIGWNYL